MLIIIMYIVGLIIGLFIMLVLSPDRSNRTVLKAKATRLTPDVRVRVHPIPSPSALAAIGNYGQHLPPPTQRRTAIIAILINDGSHTMRIKIDASKPHGARIHADFEPPIMLTDAVLADLRCIGDATERLLDYSITR